MGKWSNYKKRYNKEWEEHEEFKSWITSSSGSELLAFCKACKRHIRAHKHDLQKHNSTTKHK